MHTHVVICTCPWRLDKGFISPDTRGTDSCELPDMGTVNLIQILWKIMIYS